MSEIANPYIAGAPVVESSMFFGREDVFKWIERSLAGKYVNHILVLHGQRRVGKTSVLKQIPNFLPKNYIQVFFDLQGRTSTSLDRFLWWLASEIVRTLKKERDIDVPRPNRKAFEDTEYLIGEFLPSLRAILGDQILILTFDEFDTLDRPEIQETLARPLIAYLRRMMEMDGLNFVFSIGSSGDKLENMQASYTDFFKSALYRKISFLTLDDCHRLITKPVEGTIQYERKAVERIAEITSGHPYFTQLMCHELFALCQKTGARKIGVENVEAILGDVIERGTVNLKFVWDEASDLEKWILAGVAQFDGGTTTPKLGQLLHKQRVRFSDADLNGAVIHLRDKDIITQDNRFVIHLMRMWLLANRPLDRVREELAEVNPIANRYIEIGDEYRDRGQISQAVESYQQAIQADPGNLRAQFSIGQVHLDAKNYELAAAAYELALQIDDEDVGARTGFCDAVLAQGEAAQTTKQIETAIRFYEKILIVNPAHRDARQRLAEIHRQRAEEALAAGQDDAALGAFTKALDYAPEDDTLAARYNQILTQKKNKVIAEWIAKAERAQAQQHWDEAAGFVEEALKLDPHNEGLQAKLLEVKDAPRQHKIKGYKKEAEQAIQRGNFEKAIGALEIALLLAPGDESLTSWLEKARSNQRNARLLLIEEKINRAVTAGDWDEALESIQQARKIAPEEDDWENKILGIENARRQAQLKACRLEADSARSAGRWEEAIAALQKFREMDPGQAEIESEIEEIRLEKRQSEMAEFKASAEKNARAEKWEEAVQAWENYLQLQPDDTADVEKSLQRSRKYAKISADYNNAQEAIRKKRYERAIELLQGIIAQDPTYKSTSRLLVEAVEANKAVPPWRRGRVWGGLAAAFLLIVSIGAGIFWLGQQNFTFPIAGKVTPTSTATRAAPTLTPTPTLDPAIQAALDTIRNDEPTYQTSFDDWDFIDTGQNAALVNGKLILASENENLSEVQIYNHKAANFAVQFDFRFWDAELGVDDYNGGRCILEIGLMDELEPGEEPISSFVFFAGGGLLYKDVSLRYDETKTNTVTVIILEDQMTLVINDKIVFTDPNLGKNKRNMASFLNAQFPIVCEYDNYKYWDLQEVDPAIKTALAAISIEEPLYQTSFDDWESWGSEGTTKVESGKLIVTSENQQHAGVDLYNLISDKYAVQFDFRILDSSPEGHCVFGTSNDYDEENRINKRALSLAFWSDGSSRLSPYVYQADDHVDIATGAFDASKSNTVRLIILGEQYTVFFNGQLAYTATDPEGSAIYTRQALSANYTMGCEYDNFKIWDLSELDPAVRAALATIQSEEPVYQTSFDVWEAGWNGRAAEVENGKLILSSKNQEGATVDIYNLNSDRYAIEYELSVREAGVESHCVSENSGENRFLSFVFFGNGQTTLNKSFSDIAFGSYDETQPNKVTLLVLGDQLAAFVNGQISYFALDPDGGVSYESQALSAYNKIVCEIDNYKLWDLSGMDFSATTGATPTGTMSFFGSALASIADKTPDYEDDFSNPASGWSTERDAAGRETGYQDGVYFISSKDGCYGPGLPSNQVFSDFVLEMDVGFSNRAEGTSSIFFRNNGTAHYGANISPMGWVNFHENVNGIHIDMLGTEIPESSFSAWNVPKHLTLIARQDRMALYVNGQLVIALADTSSGQGSFHFGVCNDNDDNPLQVLIDNLKIWDITDLSP